MAALLVALGSFVYLRVNSALRRSVHQALRVQAVDSVSSSRKGTFVDSDAREAGIVVELLDTIGRHRAALESSGALERRRRARRARELRELILAELRQEVDRALADGGTLERVLGDVEAGRIDPYTAIRTIAERLRLGSTPPA